VKSRKRVSFLFALIAMRLLGMECSDFGEFKEYAGHYYALSGSKYTFSQAKQIAENNSGYLAIPNDSAENTFLASTFGTAWIGIYDPNFTQSDLCHTVSCATNASRFITIKNTPLTYANWANMEPDNRVYSTDIINGKQMVSVLGEHWIVIGPNGQWGSFGNHAQENNNPIQYKAIFEFDTKPECVLGGASSDTVLDRKCTDTIYNTGTTSTGAAITGLEGELSSSSQTFTCQTDIHGNEFCPAQMAPCAKQWDYLDGQSIQGTGTTSDYTQKICDGTMINGLCYDSSAKDATLISNLSCVTKSVQCAPGADSCCHIDITCSGNGATVKYYDCCPSQGSLKKTVNIVNVNEFISGVFYQPYTRSQGRIVCNASGACSIYFQDAYCSGSAIGSPYLTNTFTLDTSNSYVCNDSGYVNGSLISADPTKCYRQKALSCPPTHPNVQPDGTCQKTVYYTFYAYTCPDSQNAQGYNYIPSNTGGDCSTTKTDPNHSTDNSSSLDDACNSAVAPTNNCRREKNTCLDATDRPCSYVDNQWQCSPFPCFGESNLESADTSVGSTDSANQGFNNDGSCSGQIRLFNGKDMRCRSWDILFGLLGGGCCQKEKGTGLGALFGGQCKEDERLLAKYRKESMDKSHYIGEYCSKYLKLGFTKICVQKKQTYCVFNSKLARIIHEQGRPQIAMPWGEAKSPNCKGFTPEEFQKIDFSKLDLSEFYGDLESKIKTTFDAKVGVTIQQKMSSFGINSNGN